MIFKEEVADMILFNKKVRFNKVEKVSIVFYESNFLKSENKFKSIYVEKNGRA